MPEVPGVSPAFLSSGITDSEHCTEEVSFDDERTTWNVHRRIPDTASTSNPIPRQLSRTWRNSAPNTTACSSEALQLFSSKVESWRAKTDAAPAMEVSVNHFP